jgi:hypothetical protein
MFLATGGRSLKWSKGGPKVADWRRAPSGCVTPLDWSGSLSSEGGPN